MSGETANETFKLTPPEPGEKRITVYTVLNNDLVMGTIDTPKGLCIEVNHSNMVCISDGKTKALCNLGMPSAHRAAIQFGMTEYTLQQYVDALRREVVESG